MRISVDLDNAEQQRKTREHEEAGSAKAERVIFSRPNVRQLMLLFILQATRKGFAVGEVI